jgi:glycosyltransferase involved in cell wall biosynthesis
MEPESLQVELEGRTVLVVCSDWPWPPNYSARIDVLDRIHVLRQLGLIVDVLATAGQHHGVLSAAELVEEVETCFAVQRCSGLFDMFGLLETGQEYSRRRLADVVLKKSYDFVILEGHYVSHVLNNPTLKARHKILRVNNDERLYFVQLANSKWGLSSIYFLLEALRFVRTWPALMRQIPTWMFSSAKEHARSASFADKVGARNVFLPPRIDLSVMKRASSDSKQVLFLGTLLMTNNLEAVRWYVEKVHPKLLNIPGYRFCVAGNNGRFGQGGVVGEILRDVPSVILVPSPETTCSLYDQSAVFVNPMRNGAGIKLKTVHALAAGLPVVATAVGAEGTRMRHGQDIYETDDADQFAEYVRELLTERMRRQTMVANAQEQLRTHYQQSETLGNVLVDLLASEWSG